MMYLLKDVSYNMTWDKAGILSYQFFHHDAGLGWYGRYTINENGTCGQCRKFIAPYKKLEVMVKLKEFTEGR